MSGEVPRGGGEVPRGGIEDVLEGREDVDLERSTKASFGRVEDDLGGSDDSFGCVEVDFEPSNASFDRVIIDLGPSNVSFDRVMGLEMSVISFVRSDGLVRAVVIVMEDEVLMDDIALKEEDALKDVATEYKLPEVLAVERIEEDGSRPPTGSAADSPSPEGILDCVSPKGCLGKLGGGGSSSRGGGPLEANACL